MRTRCSLVDKQSSSIGSNTDVLKRLASRFHEAETGTFFTTTADNKACHVLLDKDRITALC
ncbi:hypothetical protein [Methylophaga sp.]|uniref:hypothetical protein n=1 Tax=Methylophaga sp. TaxID=2024840 RepID=UPI0013FE91B6|nr:hypothetical protein [Methylophaga sp.]MTI63830.1 hypothetical protein [Methylophaga sp.]